MAGLNSLGHGGKLTGWVDPGHGFAIDGPNIPVKLTINWLGTISEIADLYMGSSGLCFSPSIEAKIKDVPTAEGVLDWAMWPKALREASSDGENRRGEGTLPYSEIEPWGDERNRKVGGDFIIHVNSLELRELLWYAIECLHIWEGAGAEAHLLSTEDGYDFYHDDIRGHRMLYYATLRSLKTAVKRLKRLEKRLEDVLYAEA